jgi:uncharacterized membrane protein
MNKFSHAILFILSLAGALVLSALLWNYLNCPSTREVKGMNKPAGPVVEGASLIQEFRAEKNYLYGFDIVLATWARHNTNLNEIRVVNDRFQILYSRKFSSADVVDNAPFQVRFAKGIHTGKGKLLYLCLYSPDGTELNNITAWTDTTGWIGKLYRPESGDTAVAGMIMGRSQPLKGCLTVNIRESQFSDYRFVKILLAVAILVIIALIIFVLRKYRSFLVGIEIRPQKLYLLVSLTAGFGFAVITPPTMVPDEASHFLRAYQVSRFNILKVSQTVPASLAVLSAKCWFYPGKKTTPAELIALARIKLKPRNEMIHWTYNPFIPYIPQALGIDVANLLGLPPILMLYLGRIFNLLFSILIIYTAIRIIPAGKWVLFLLALMPMTLYEMASLSYDGMTISLSFLLISLFIKYSVNDGKILTRLDLIALFGVSILLSLCKPPYYILVFLYFLIPMNKIGSLRKYGLMFLLLLSVCAIANPMWYLVRSLFAPYRGLLQIPILYDPQGQVAYVTHHILWYARLLVADVFSYNRDYYLSAMFGVLGWLEFHLPDLLRDIYLPLILVAALAFPFPGFRLGTRKRLVIVTVLAAGIALIQTALYLFLTPVGLNFVSGIQGRYLIPFAPLLFLLLYNRTLLIPGGEEEIRLKFCRNSFLILSTGIALVSLFYAMFMIINRYYV